jgi:2-oxoglutarate dehydrogenase E2 component (dihydrolipoamide succinyltransferase)
MKIEVIMPKMGESINEGTVIKWLKKVGDQVKKDEIIFEIATDKVDTEIPSPAGGTLDLILVNEQETVDVDTVVAIINSEGVEEAAQSRADESLNVVPVKEEDISATNTVDILMPLMGESLTEGTVIKWYKNVGDSVKKDETFFEIATDKVDTEIPSPVNGVVSDIFCKENETVAVDTLVARIKTSDVVMNPKHEETSEIQVLKREDETSLQQPKIVASNSNRFYSPLVMNIARKENVSLGELETIQGTGARGRVTKNDILIFIEQKNSGVKSQVSNKILRTIEIPSQTFGSTETEIIPMDNIRQRIMEHMIKSRDTSVHVTAINEVDMSKVHNYIQLHKDELWDKEKIKLTYMSFISYVCVNALKEFPLINSSVEGSNIMMKKFINLGIAVAVEPNGLIVPNIKNAEKLNVIGFAKAVAGLSEKARNKGLLPDDIMNGTFSITNYGVFGLQFGTPIINQPEVAILGVGAVIKKPVVVEVDGVDSITIKPMMYLSISHDHRLVDGMLGGKFLKHIKDKLENFDVGIA